MRTDRQTRVIRNADSTLKLLQEAFELIAADCGYPPPAGAVPPDPREWVKRAFVLLKAIDG